MLRSSCRKAGIPRLREAQQALDPAGRIPQLGEPGAGHDQLARRGPGHVQRAGVGQRLAFLPAPAVVHRHPSARMTATLDSSADRARSRTPSSGMRRKEGRVRRSAADSRYRPVLPARLLPVVGQDQYLSGPQPQHPAHGARTRQVQVRQREAGPAVVFGGQGDQEQVPPGLAHQELAAVRGHPELVEVGIHLEGQLPRQAADGQEAPYREQGEQLRGSGGRRGRRSRSTGRCDRPAGRSDPGDGCARCPCPAGGRTLPATPSSAAG